MSIAYFVTANNFAIVGACRICFVAIANFVATIGIWDGLGIAVGFFVTSSGKQHTAQ